MRVLFISHSAVVPVYRDKLRRLAAAGCDLHLVLPTGWPEGGRWQAAPPPGPERGVQVHVLPVWFPGRVGAFGLRGLGRLVRQVRPDIVHAEEEPYSWVCAQALAAARRARAAFVFFTWENIIRRYHPPLSWLFRRATRLSRWAVAGNQDGVEVLRHWGFRGEIRVLPQYGVDPERFSPAPRPAGSAPWTAGYVGRLVEEKGLVALLNALRLVEPPVRLRLIGAGPLRDTLRGLAGQLGVAERVVFDAPVSNERIPEVLRSLDALVLPSETRPGWKEQFGRVLIEAMACEVPVIGSDSGEIPRVVGDGGWIVPEGDAAALAARLGWVRDHPQEAAAAAQRGRQRVLERFTTERLVAQTLALYRELMGEGRT